MFTTFQEPAPSIVSDWSISSRYTVAHRTNRHGALECIYRGVVLHSRRRVGFESDRKPSIEYSFSTAPSEPAIGFPSTRFYVNTRDTLTPAVCRITSIQMLIIFFFYGFELGIVQTNSGSSSSSHELIRQCSIGTRAMGFRSESFFVGDGEPIGA